MPTYACSTAAGRLTPAQKTDIVRCISTVHHEETGAPRYLVQVIFYEVASGNHYIAGNLHGPTKYGSEAISGAGGLRNGKARSFAGYCKALPSPPPRPRRRSGSIFPTFPRPISPSMGASCRFREMRMPGSWRSQIL
jgi:phenylpyruvate tautomerase PptA (4-oxalocrotonate tautomerase family)